MRQGGILINNRENIAEIYHPLRNRPRALLLGLLFTDTKKWVIYVGNIFSRQKSFSSNINFF